MEELSKVWRGPLIARKQLRQLQNGHAGQRCEGEKFIGVSRMRYCTISILRDITIPIQMMQNCIWVSSVKSKVIRVIIWILQDRKGKVGRLSATMHERQKLRAIITVIVNEAPEYTFCQQR